jgi:DMSO/TMAO reductase YedYZ molybdopterin-dependent catalytic subunit
MSVTVRGRERVWVPTRLSDCERFEIEQRESPLYCHTGRELGQTWRGIPVAELLAAARMPPETTHLLVVGDGDYRMCIDVRDAVEALLAYECDGDTISDGETRLVGPGIDSTHSVKAVRRIEGVELSADEDPRELETDPE